MASSDVLSSRARQVIDDNKYLVLGTVEPDGQPRLSPVYFTHHDYRAFYWVSSPDAQHSRNAARHPAVTIVIFDSSVPVGAGKAVYLTATAVQAPAGECTLAYRDTGDGAVAFTPEELSGDEPLRLYRATALTCEVHIRGSDPEFGTGVDTRRAISLGR